MKTLVVLTMFGVVIGNWIYCEVAIARGRTDSGRPLAAEYAD